MNGFIHTTRRSVRRASSGALLVAALALNGCGGGGGDGSGTPPIGGTPDPTPTGPTYTAGVYPASASFKARCNVPRTGTDPATGRAYPDVAGTALYEKHWLRSWTNELYLWYSEVVDMDPASTAGILAYFDLLKTRVLTASGSEKDRFHFTYDTAEYRQLSQSGVTADYGASWKFVRNTPPRNLVIAYVEPNSPAANASLGRGMKVTAIDGIDLVNDNTSAGIASLNAALAPDGIGRSHQFTLQDRNGASRNVTLTSANVTIKPVPVARMISPTVGYLLFNDHIATAERDLVDAVNVLRTGGARDLVLDLRYNGGGYLDIASELGFMIGGSNVTGKTFEKLQFNSKYPTTNPVIGGALTPEPFHATSQGFSIASGQALPTLNLSRVFVLTSPSTCSASEALINGLNGAGVQVIQIGKTTCGKPYGFYATDNCGTTYFSIQFTGVNHAGFGEYPDGFSANRSVGDSRANLPGCERNDDFAHDLGDPAENQIAAALSYTGSGFCAAPAVADGPDGPRAMAAQLGEGGLPLLLPTQPARQNRILRAP